MSIRRIVMIVATLVAAGFVVAAMAAYTRRVEAGMRSATVDGGTIAFLKDRTSVESFAARDITGRPISLRDFRGKVVIVNFWATWCPPCREEIPDLVALQDRYKDQLQIIGISQDEAPPEEVGRFATAHRMNYPIVMTTPEIEEMFPNVRALPTSFIVDPEGRVAQRHIGMLNASLTETETRALAGLPVNVKIEYVEDQDRQRLENAAQANTIPGVDLSKLTPQQRTRALQALNSEPCTCGCGQTVAQCRIEDPTCSVSLPRAQEIIKGITGGSAP